MPSDPAVPVRRRTASDLLEGALLAAAQTVLDRDTLANVSVRSVAREAGVAPMGVYNRFGSKEGMLLALAVRALDDLRQAVEVAPGLDPEVRFRQACRGYRAFARAHPQRYQLIFGGGGPVAEHGSPASKLGKDVFDVLKDLVGAVMSTADSHSLGRAEAAQIVWSAIHGAVDLELSGIEQVSTTADASYELLVDLLVRGLA